MSIASKYKKSLDEQWCLRFKTLHPDGDSFDGVVTQIKRDFIVLREEMDLEFDGIIVLRKGFIQGFRDGKYEACRNEILRQNGSMRNRHSPRWLDGCDTIPDLIAEMKRRDIWPGIETIFNDNSETAFYIGPITQISEDHCYLKCYDAAGKWEKAYRLGYDEMFRIEFESRYCKHFNAFMRRREDA